MKTKTFWAALCLLLLSACGPMIGGMMVASNGVKDFKVVQGNLSDLPSGAQVAVLGPFAKTSKAFYICRGEDSAAFSSAFNQSGLFFSELAIDTRFPDELPVASQFKNRPKEELQKALGLKKVPDFIMSGTILSREMTAAPAAGIIMTAAYRLEFLNLQSGKTTIVEVNTKALFQDVITKSVERLAQEMGNK